MAKVTLTTKDGQKARLTIGKYVPVSQAALVAKDLVSATKPNDLKTSETDGKLVVQTDFSTWGVITQPEAEYDVNKED